MYRISGDNDTEGDDQDEGGFDRIVVVQRDAPRKGGGDSLTEDAQAIGNQHEAQECRRGRERQRLSKEDGADVSEWRNTIRRMWWNANLQSCTDRLVPEPIEDGDDRKKKCSRARRFVYEALRLPYDSWAGVKGE